MRWYNIGCCVDLETLLHSRDRLQYSRSIRICSERPSCLGRRLALAPSSHWRNLHHPSMRARQRLWRRRLVSARRPSPMRDPSRSCCGRRKCDEHLLPVPMTSMTTTGFTTSWMKVLASSGAIQTCSSLTWRKSYSRKSLPRRVLLLRRLSRDRRVERSDDRSVMECNS
jgi:hypothetical protein